MHRRKLKLQRRFQSCLQRKVLYFFDRHCELCPTCGHPMPLEATKAKRAERVSAIDAKVKCIVIDDCQSKLSAEKLTPCDLVSTTDLEASLASYREPIDFAE